MELTINCHPHWGSHFYFNITIKKERENQEKSLKYKLQILLFSKKELLELIVCLLVYL